MTQSPYGGQTAPRSTDFGPVTTSQPTRAGGNPPAQPWSPPASAPSQPTGHGSGFADNPTGALPGTAPASSAPSTPKSGRAARTRGPRRARLQLRHINPWTVLKFSSVLSVALFFVWLITIGVLYGILDGAGIIGKINDTVTTIQGGNASAPVTSGIVFGSAAIIGVINMVLFIALSTIGSLVYNLCADLVGGVEITLSER